MSFNNSGVFNSKSQNGNNCINRAPGSERRTATTNNSYIAPIASNLLCNLPRTRNNSGELNLAPGANRPSAMQRSAIDSPSNASERSLPNSDLSFPILHYDHRPCTDLAPGSNRPSNNVCFSPHNSNIVGSSSRQMESFSIPNMALIGAKKPVQNLNESKACDTYNNEEFALSQCEDYNNSFYDRCVDNQRLRITCDHRIIKFSKDVRNVPHSLCVGSTQMGSMDRHPSLIANYETCKQVATQMMTAINNEERKTRGKLIKELARARSSVCSQIERYTVMEANVQLNISNVEMGIKNYFQKNIEFLERRKRELLKYLEEQKHKQLKVLTMKLQNFHEYNLKITQLNDALTCIQNSNNFEEIKKVNETVRKEIKSLNYKMNGIAQYNPLVVLFEEADIRMHHNIAALGCLRTKTIEITNRVVMQDLCRKGRAILGASYMVKVSHPTKPVRIGENILCRPWGTCCDELGTIYVGDRSNHRIAIFSPDGTLIGSIGQHGTGPLEFNRPAGVAIDLLGRLIVADKDNHRIQILTTTGEPIRTIGGTDNGSGNSQFHYPWDVAVNMNGDFVVTDSRNKRIQLFDLHGNFKGKFCFTTIFTVRKPKSDPSPRGVCFTPTGDILVTDFQNLCVVAISHDLKNYRVLQFEKQFARPQGVICDDFGNIIVADSRDNQIKVFRHTGQHVFTAAQMGAKTGALQCSNGLCLTPEGRILAADLANNCLVLY